MNFARRLSTGLAAAALLFASMSLAEDAGPVPERRLVIERNVDFAGADLRALFDTTLEACQSACLTDPDCQAFTFNGRSNSCFPKRGIAERTPYQGAVSGRVVDTPADVLALAAVRAAELDFLRPEDLDAARAESEAMAGRYRSRDMTEAELRRAFQDARQREAFDEALRWSGAALVLTDRAEHWLNHADTALRVSGANGKQTRQLRARALPASINAYLRSADPAVRSAALRIMAVALEGQRRGRDMIPALRLAAELWPGESVARELDDALGRFGFQVTEHNIQSNPAEPRVCARFSEDLAPGTDYEPYVQLPGDGFAIEADGRDLCIDGLAHGQRYRVVLRAGLPSASGEQLAKDVPLSIYVRDRAPSVRFPGRAYVLPRTPDAALPIVTVNLTEVDLTLRRISDRNIVDLIRQDLFGRPLDTWEEQQLAAGPAEEVWRGTGEIDRRLNRDTTTLLPLSEAIAGLPAGLYALQARVPGADDYETPPATQWFVISDIGLASMDGTDGLHVFARALSTAAPMAGLELSLISRSNRVLGTASTDANGYVRFDPGLSAGRGGAAPALLLASAGQDDLGFLSLSGPEFDLSDRGVEGRPAAGPIDVFLATDRGAYRAGETIHATVLARDPRAMAIPDLPLTAILTRPDGVEYSRLVSDGGVAGGHVFSLPVGPTVPRGSWKLAIHADTASPALATRSLLVEDFLPERIDVNLQLPETGLRLTDTPPLRVEARYLFGAPGADLPIEGEVQVRAAGGLAEFPGFRFGLHDDGFDPAMKALVGQRTGPDGHGNVPLAFPDVAETDRPLEAVVTARVSEGSGRPVERRLVRPLVPARPLIGIRPQFDGVLPENTEARFSLIGVGPDLAPLPMRVRWELNRIETRYQWYSNYGQWNWEPITRRSRVDSGEAQLGDVPIDVSAPVGWGQYELVVERRDGPYVASSVSFDAGWYAPAGASASPDLLDVSLDKAAYLTGETAHLRIVARDAGKALVTVASNRLIAMKTLDLPEGESLVDLPVTDEWGAGAYVTATLIRPMDADTGRNPTRALGLAHAAVDPGAARLSAGFDVPATAKPRAPLAARLRVEGVAQGETAHATIAAVDRGILNLTGHEPPDASGHYFGQREFGMGLRDIYGQLIDGHTGTPGRIRSGGDAGALRMQAPPPTEELVALFSGPVEIGEDGTADVVFDMPAFNGQVALMAVVWTDSAVGEAAADVLVRDPVVLSASLPRFLAPGDESRLLLELTHADGPAGAVQLEVSARGLALASSSVPSSIDLAEGGTLRLSVPVAASEPGLGEIDVTLSPPDGEPLVKTLMLPVQVNDPEIATTSRFTLAPGGGVTLTPDIFAGLGNGSASATLALGPLGKLNAPGLLEALDRYPYGCTEQVTSQALPLIYLSGVAAAMDIASADGIDERIRQALDVVLSRQTTEGGFGLWQPVDGDFWLDAYVTDFLSRARAEGHAVPERAFAQAMDNLRNQLNYAADFRTGGEDIAYALLVLAREGAAPIGDLRYFADVKGGDFGTPMATAQIGAALAMYGDQARADAMFRRAAGQLLPLVEDETESVWRSDFGTNLRDSAAVLTLAAESGSAMIDRPVLTDRVIAGSRGRSTQESAWTLLAAHALIDEPGAEGFLVDGAPASDPVLRLDRDRLVAAPLTVTNTGSHEAVMTLTTFGVPEGPAQRRSQGYEILRRYYSMDGEPVDPANARQGDRRVVVLTVTPFERSEARLMVNDPLPAGFEIDNPSLVEGGDIAALDWLETAETRIAEFRQDRFLAAVDWRSDKSFQLAYIVRAVSPGHFHHPAASVEDMYRPQFRGRTAPGRVAITQ